MNAAFASPAASPGPPWAGSRRSARFYGRVWRGSRLWAALFGAAFIIRTALDWFAPPTDFQTRAAISTALGVGLLLAASFHASVRSGSVTGGVLSSVVTAGLGGLIGAAGAACLLAGWHDPATLRAIERSGGLGEVFTLPVMLLMPGVVFGTVGGLVGSAAARWRRN